MVQTYNAKARLNAKMDEYANFANNMNLKQQRERIHVGDESFRVGKRQMKGLGASNNESDDYLEKTLKETQIIKRGKLTKTDHDTKIKVLRAYEKTIVNKEVEHGIVIDLDGNVYEVIGQNDGCRIDKLGKAILNDAYVTHNHPKEETYYSFSSADMGLYTDFNINTLRRIDYKYVYEFNRNFDSQKQELEECFSDELDEDDRGISYDYEHWSICRECLAKKINYWREKR